MRDEAGHAARSSTSVYRDHGRLDGVIHGAGVIEDKLVEDKTPESFDRVFDTKADERLRARARAAAGLAPVPGVLRSVAGRFGNRGQADYAAANEVLNKLAVHLDRALAGPRRVAQLGAVGKTGMVSPELQREFARRGVELISIPHRAPAASTQELRHGTAGEPEVVLAGGAWSAQAEVTERAGAAAGGRLPAARITRSSMAAAHVVEVDATLDPSRTTPT